MSEYHIGRSWSGHELEDACADCGFDEPTQGHRDECPGKLPEKGA